MSIIDKILLEWRYLLPAGYPKTDSDYHKLSEVLSEMTDLDVATIQRIVEQARTGNIITEQEEVDQSITDKIVSIGLPDNITNQVLEIYNNFSDQEQQEFDKNFRVHTIDSFFSSGYKAFTKFYNIINSEKSTGDMGFGEVQVLLAVRDSQPGGTAQHDIIMPAGEWEVKQIGTSQSANQLTFRPAKVGMPQEGDLLYQLREFYRDIVIPFSGMGDPLSELKQLVDENSYNELETFIKILTEQFVPHIDRIKIGREISYVPLNNLYVSFKQLNNIFWKTNLDSDIQDTRMSIKSRDKQSTYWISDDDYEKIEKAADEDSSIDINVGQQIDNENSNIQVWFARIKRSKFILTPDTFIVELNTIKSKLYNEILGLIVYQYQKPGVPIRTTREDWSIVALSGGQWVFGLNRTFDSKYTFIQIQS
jgi:hypothetical protein